MLLFGQQEQYSRLEHRTADDTYFCGGNMNSVEYLSPKQKMIHAYIGIIRIVCNIEENICFSWG